MNAYSFGDDAWRHNQLKYHISARLVRPQNGGGCQRQSHAQAGVPLGRPQNRLCSHGPVRLIALV